MIYWCFCIDNWPEFHEDIGQTFTRHKQSLINLRTPDQSGQIENHNIHPIHPMMLWKDILHICQTVSLPKWNLHEKGTSKFCVLRLSTNSFKWWIFSQTSSKGSGKNKKWVKMWVKNFLPKSCPELSNQVLSFSICQIC